MIMKACARAPSARSQTGCGVVFVKTIVLNTLHCEHNSILCMGRFCECLPLLGFDRYFREKQARRRDLRHY